MTASELYQRLFLPHYIVNFLYILPFIIIRYVHPLASYFLDLSLKPPETKIFFIFTCILLLKYRTTNSAEEFLSVLFLYGKLLNTLMFYWYGKPMWTIAYAVGCGVLFAALPQPDYQGNSKIVKLTLEDLRDIQRNSYQVPKISEIKDDDDEKVKGKGKAENDNYWVIFFYVTWSNVCRNFESTVAKASLKYTTSNIHFGKFDIDESPELTQEYDISSAPTSLDLPTLILLKNGREHGRLPWKVKDGTEEDLDRIKSEKLRSAKIMWDRLGWDRSMESIISEFKLDALHKST